MIAVDDIEAAWSLLEHPLPVKNELRVRELDAVTTAVGHPLFAVDEKGYRHLLIPVSPTADIREDKRSAGVQVVVNSLVDANKMRLFVDVTCRKPHLNKLFSIILSEILNMLSESVSRPDLICHQVLNRWRELLERGPSGRPDLQTVAGVFGELWQLREVVRLDSNSIDCWLGPTGARHDLAAGGTALEVKTTLARSGRFFTINGHDQLEPPADGILYLAAMRLEQVKTKGETIADLINTITSMGGDQYMLLTLLADIGITPDVVEACSDIHFRVDENRFYRVDSSFPRIVSGSFAGGVLPDGVLKVSYQIDLSTEPPVPLGDSEVKTVYRSLAVRRDV